MSKRKQNRGSTLSLISLGTIVYTAIVALLLRGKDIALLNPKGFTADEQFNLLAVSTAIMVVFAAIVLFFIYFFAWKYRETNHKNEHNPQAGRSKLLLFTAWASPIAVFVVLAGIMLPATQKLEPQRAIESDNEEIVVRVVAMRWKWLFLYPEHDIATVNYVQIPVDTPVRFELTADESPMNSFWIPHLGGMLYAMTEHVNTLNLMGHTVGEYDGGAAEINGDGFAGMRFTTSVTTKEDFDSWISGAQNTSATLDAGEYSRLLQPTEYDPVMTYHSPTNKELFDNLLKKYAGSSNKHMAGENDHESGGGGH